MIRTEQTQPDDGSARETETAVDDAKFAATDPVAGALRLSGRGAILAIGFWTVIFGAYGFVSGLNIVSVLLGIFVGFVVLLELTTVNESPPWWHERARPVLVAGFLLISLLVAMKLLSILPVGVEIP
jgi:hypothetical protein